ncbi:MarR family transcriptional regulator [Streptomyces mirabilis]|uniref:MarR family transcriptional regulator n=1 Tax=Streptomyces mirabilis TaxID=68239 RepID=UPI0036697A4D
MANPGYGIRTALGEPGEANRIPDFEHLPAREAYIAAFIDRLPEGAAMDVKSLAKVLPLYGQQAVGTALNVLSRAGHLRRVRRLAEAGDSGTRWVFRTHWSRIARDDEWWARILTDDTGGAVGAVGLGAPAEPAAVAPLREASSTPDEALVAPASTSSGSTAYQALAQLGRSESRLPLSAADCTALVELAAAWFERGATIDSFTSGLTSGLPDVVHAPRALVARRLRDKLPPDLGPDVTLPSFGSERHGHDTRRAILECTECGVPGRPEALPGGLCRACGSHSGEATSPTPVTSTPDVHRHASHIRAALTFRKDQANSRTSGLIPTP